MSLAEYDALEMFCVTARDGSSGEVNNWKVNVYSNIDTSDNLNTGDQNYFIKLLYANNSINSGKLCNKDVVSMSLEYSIMNSLTSFVIVASDAYAYDSEVVIGTTTRDSDHRASSTHNASKTVHVCHAPLMGGTDQLTDEQVAEFKEAFNIFGMVDNNVLYQFILLLSFLL